MSTVDKSVLHLDGLAQAELVRRKEVSPAELVELSIGAIETINPQLNAVITPMFDLAREAARGPLPDGPFRGVPFLLKDHLASFAGVRQTNASKLFLGYVADYDSELVRRYKQAGFVTLGKTNLSEFAILPTAEPMALGATRNPWNTGDSPGGSSGGSAAAVAARLVPIAYGSDVGGSIRIPASCCGVFGLKPTRARNPAGPVFTEFVEGYVGEHVLTRSVRDSAAVLDATSGPEVGDAYCAPPQVGSFLEAVGRPPRKLRIGFSVASPLQGPVHKDCMAAVNHAAKLCQDLGHDVVEMPLALPMDVDTLVKVYTAVMFVGSSISLAAFEQSTGRKVSEDQVEPLTFALYQRAQSIPALQFELARMALQRVARGMGRLFEKIDVWLSPTLAEPPVPLGTFSQPPENPLASMEHILNYVSFTILFNVTGQPAASVPLFWNRDNLPIGVQIVGKFGDETTLLQLAAQFETIQPWAQRIPPVSA